MIDADTALRTVIIVVVAALTAASAALISGKGYPYFELFGSLTALLIAVAGVHWMKETTSDTT